MTRSTRDQLNKVKALLQVQTDVEVERLIITSATQDLNAYLRLQGLSRTACAVIKEFRRKNRNRASLLQIDCMPFLSITQFPMSAIEAHRGGPNIP